VNGELREGGNLPLIPANTLQNTLRFELKDYERFKKTFVYLTLENVFDQNKVSFSETPTDGYSLLSLGAGTTIQTKKLQWQLGFSVTNLTDEDYIAHLSRLKVDGISNQGRSVNFNLKVSL
jgi:iron complex outermembrane receptor protein